MVPRETKQPHRVIVHEESSQEASARRIAPKKPTVMVRDPVGPFLHYLMAECGVSPHTLAAYRSDLMGFIRWRKAKAPVELAKLDALKMADYVDTMHRAKLSPSTICRRPGEPLDVLPLSRARRSCERKHRQAIDRAGSLGPLADCPEPRGGVPPARVAECPDQARPSRPGHSRDALRHGLPGLGGRGTSPSGSRSDEGNCQVCR